MSGNFGTYDINTLTAAALAQAQQQQQQMQLQQQHQDSSGVAKPQLNFMDIQQQLQQLSQLQSGQNVQQQQLEQSLLNGKNFASTLGAAVTNNMLLSSVQQLPGLSANQAPTPIATVIGGGNGNTNAKVLNGSAVDSAKQEENPKHSWEMDWLASELFKAREEVAKLKAENKVLRDAKNSTKEGTVQSALQNPMEQSAMENRDTPSLIISCQSQSPHKAQTSLVDAQQALNIQNMNNLQQQLNVLMQNAAATGNISQASQDTLVQPSSPLVSLPLPHT